MNNAERTYRLSRSRVVIISDDSAGRPHRLSIVGRRLKTRPGQVWATTIAKHAVKDQFQIDAGKALDKVARPLDGFGFTIDNVTDGAVTLDGFPTVPANSSVSVALKDGKWAAK
jgi:hypothetical protein